MNYKINLYVSEIKSINRTLIINDDVPLQLFIKSMILSLNGDTNDIYLLEKDDVIDFNDSDKVSCLNLEVGDVFRIVYNYSGKTWELEFKVLEKNKDLNKQNIEVIACFLWML